MLDVKIRTHFSLIDLMEGGDSRDAIAAGDWEALKEILFNVGMKKEDIKFHVGIHRPRFSHQIIDGGYFDSFERDDDAWLLTGCASQEMIILNLLKNNRNELAKELTFLYDVPAITGLVIENMRREK